MVILCSRYNTTIKLMKYKSYKHIKIPFNPRHTRHPKKIHSIVNKYSSDRGPRQKGRPIAANREQKVQYYTPPQSIKPHIQIRRSKVRQRDDFDEARALATYLAPSSSFSQDAYLYAYAQRRRRTHTRRQQRPPRVKN